MLRFVALVFCIVSILLSPAVSHHSSMDSAAEMARQTFNIGLTWDGEKLEGRTASLSLAPVTGTGEVIVSVSAPFYDDPPPPGGLPGQAYFGLWEYEVVEAFFLNEKDQYLEVEFGPHGQHIVLLLDGRRNAIKHTLPMEYTASIDRETMTWRGEARLPRGFFPPDVSLFNAFAIHGTGEDRKYEALYEVSGPQPDFHRIDKFQPVDFSDILPGNKGSQLSPLWYVSIEEDKLNKKD